MNKIKSFSSKHLDQLDDQINGFINNNMKIISITFEHIGEGFSILHYAHIHYIINENGA